MADLGVLRGQRREPCQFMWAACTETDPRPACEGCDGDGTRWVTQNDLTNLLHMAVLINDWKAESDG